MKTRGKTHPFKARDLHRFERRRVEHHGGAKFKHVAEELIRLRERKGEEAQLNISVLLQKVESDGHK